MSTPRSWLPLPSHACVPLYTSCTPSRPIPANLIPPTPKTVQCIRCKLRFAESGWVRSVCLPRMLEQAIALGLVLAYHNSSRRGTRPDLSSASWRTHTSHWLTTVPSAACASISAATCDLQALSDLEAGNQQQVSRLSVVGLGSLDVKFCAPCSCHPCMPCMGQTW